MEKLTYNQAYNLIIDAYFKDEIKPFDAMFCFCGTLCGGTKWHGNSDEGHHNYIGYTGDNFIKMERALIRPLCDEHYFPEHWITCFEGGSTEYENALFAGMSAALDVLKEIHRSRGEDVDEVQIPFTQRVLTT